jgi:hypothetical protein
MTGLSQSPQLIKGGIVLIDPQSAAVQRIIALQYSPDSLSRTLQVQGVGEVGEQSEALRLKGPAVETLKLDAEIDATDSLEHPDQNANAVAFGIAPQLAALESLVNPNTTGLLALNALSQSGTLEILPPEAHNYHVNGCDPFSSKPAAPPSQGAKKTSTTGGEE